MRRLSSRFVLSTALALTGATSLTAGAQLPPPMPSDKSPAPAGENLAYDVASIREHTGDDGMVRWMYKQDGFSTTNINLQSLLASAYNVKMDLVSGGPSWLGTKGFDIEAKALPGDGGAAKLTEAQRQAMLRTLLAERFHVKAHVEAKILPIYDLVVAKGGPKMEVAPPLPPSTDNDHKGGGMSMRPGHLDATRYNMTALANQLGYLVQRTVLDKTGLTADYNFHLDWLPEEQAGAAGDAASAGTDVHPPIYTAVQEQLGLKLEPSKGPVDTLVVDHAELPTAN